MRDTLPWTTDLDKLSSGRRACVLDRNGRAVATCYSSSDGDHQAMETAEVIVKAVNALFLEASVDQKVPLPRHELRIMDFQTSLAISEKLDRDVQRRIWRAVFQEHSQPYQDVRISLMVAVRNELFSVCGKDA